MSVVGKSVADTSPVTVYQPVGLVAGVGGPIAVAGSDGTSLATAINPLPTSVAQGLIISGPVTMVAATAMTLIAAFADRRGMRVLNYTASPVYLTHGVTGTPPSGAGSDFIPAAVDGVPGVWEPRYAPVSGIRAVGAAAGGLTVTVW